MPSGRNIADFFKPYIKPKSKVVDDDDIFDNINVLDDPSQSSSRGTSSGQHASRATDAGAISGPPDLRKPSTMAREEVEPKAVSKTVSFSSELTSLSPTPPAATFQDGTRRVMRQLSPLSSRSSKSPSPQPLRSRHAIPDSIPPAKWPHDASLSLGSSSGLSAPPISSQSSSRRVVRDGQLAVTNSDSDSVDQDDDPLDDIEELIRRKRTSMGSAGLDAIAKGGTDSVETRALRSSIRKPPAPMRKAGPPPKKKYKFDLASLARQSKVEAAWAEKQKEYAYLEAINEESDAVPEDGQDELDRIADQLRGEDGDVQEKGELVRAMKRIDALHDDIRYHFFKPTTYQSHPKLPSDSLKESKTWAKIMKSQESREQAFLTGFVSDMIHIAPLPDAIIEWLLQDLIYDTRDNLSMAYVSVLEEHFKTRPASLEVLRDSLLSLAGREDFSSGVDIKAPVSPESPNTRRNAKSLHAARWSSILVGRVCETLPVAEQRSWLHILMLVLLDQEVQEDISTKLEVQSSLSNLMQAITPDRLDTTCRSLGMNILKATSNPILLHRLLHALPSTAPHLHTFKRRLALAAVMKSEDYLTDSLDDLSLTYTVVAHLRKNAKFRIREATDFAALGARIGMLDIAVGAGFSDFAFVSNRSAALDAEDGEDASAARKRGPPSAAEKAFDEAIDALVGELRTIASNIRDAGAAHMQRTECKGVLEKLSYRLEYAARTRPKPKRSIFSVGGGGGDMNANVVDMFTRGGAIQN